MIRSRLRWAGSDLVLLAVALSVATALVAFAGTTRLERTMTDFLLLAMLVVGLQTFVGNSGIVSFGHVAFVGIGAYTAALVTIPEVVKSQALPDLPASLAGVELGLVPSMILGALVAAVVAALLGGAISRMSELGMAVATLALLVLAHAILSNWDSVTRGGYGIFGIPRNATLWMSLIALLITIAIAVLYRASQPGLRLQAAREDPLSAAASGINVSAERFWAFVLSAGLMGGGGALLAQHLIAFEPDQFYFALTFTTLSMLVLGGRASVTGAVVGAGVITIVSDFLRRFEQGFDLGSLQVPELRGLVQLTIAILIILVLIFRPEGLLGRWELIDLLQRRRRHTPDAEAPAGETQTEPPAEAAVAELGAEPALRVASITMDFVGLRALDEVSLALRPEEILGLIGPNGSGKTTLLNVMTGVLHPVSGRVELDGCDITGWPAHKIARAGLARTFQSIRLFKDLTVRENVMAAAPKGASDAQVDRILGLFDLTPLDAALAGTLAYGEQRRVEAARAAVRRPLVLLLDEPAAGMNETESERLLEIVRTVRAELGCALVVIDHDLRLIFRLSNRVQVLNEGATIADGSPDEIGRDPVVIEAYLGRGRDGGAPVEVEPSEG